MLFLVDNIFYKIPFKNRGRHTFNFQQLYGFLAISYHNLGDIQRVRIQL